MIKGIWNNTIDVGELHSLLYFTMFTFNDVITIHDSIVHTAQKDTIHQVTTMLATSKNVLFPGHNHLLATGTDDPSL